MMKRIISALCTLIITLSLLPVFTVPASAAHNYHQEFDGDVSGSGIIDEKGIFEGYDEDLDALKSMIRETAEDLEMNIYVWVAGNSRSDYSTEIFADDTYDEMFGEDTDGVFYYLDISGKSPAYDYISTSGKAVLLYQKKIESIFSSLDNYLPASGETVYEDKIYLAIQKFLGLLRDYADNTPGFLNYYHDSSSGKYFYYMGGEYVVTKSKPPALWLLIGVIGTGIGLITALICYFAIKSGYKFKKTTDPSVYVEKGRTNFLQQSDTFMRSYVTKHKIESSSGGGSRGGGGGHSHSGGHGGGGHHR